MEVHVEPGLAGVASNGGIAGADGEIGGGRGGLLHPVLGGGVAEVEQDGREARDGVRLVGDAELGAGLLSHELDEVAVADARRAVGIDVGLVAGLANVARGDGGDGCAEGVARDGNCVLGICGRGGLETREGLGLEGDPRGKEARVHKAAGGQIARHLREDQAGFDVRQRVLERSSAEALTR